MGHFLLEKHGGLQNFELYGWLKYVLRYPPTGVKLKMLPQMQPLAFNITLSRTYRWQTENQVDQSTFLEALVQLFRIVNPSVPLDLDGLSDPNGSGI